MAGDDKIEMNNRESAFRAESLPAEKNALCEENADSLREHKTLSDKHADETSENSELSADSPDAAVAAASDDLEEAAESEIDRIAEEHDALREIFGLDKHLDERGCINAKQDRPGARPYVVLAIAAIVVSSAVGIWIGFHRYSESRDEALAIAKHDAEIAYEEARRNRIEYADIAFLDSIPPLVDISMEGRKLYAKTKDGAFTELRARESTWIQNLPIKEDTVLHFGFSAEGFMPMSRSVAYYDWFPSNRPGGNPLQKAFKKIILVPDNDPRVKECAQLPKIGDADPCEWSVLRELVFRERYAQAVKSAVVEEKDKNKLLAQNFDIHPMLRSAAVGIDFESLASGKEFMTPEAPDATKQLIKNISENPFGLYGSITIETDMPETRVFFMSEPLMVVKPSGAMAQVQVQPDKPYTFSVYGNGRPIDITQKLTIRLEAPNAPAYVTEITPLQWHCSVPGIDKILSMTAPAIPEEIMMPDYRQHICDYSRKISVKFSEIKALEADMQKAAQEKEKAENEAAEKAIQAAD